MGLLLGVSPRVHGVACGSGQLPWSSWPHCGHCHPLPLFAYFLLGYSTPGKQGLMSQKERQERVTGTKGCPPQNFLKASKRGVFLSCGGLFSQTFSLPLFSLMIGPCSYLYLFLSSSSFLFSFLLLGVNEGRSRANLVRMGG